MRYVVGALALVLFVLLGDRLRQIRWPVSQLARLLRRPHVPSTRGDAKPLYVAMYLLKTCYALGMLGVCIFTDEATWRLGLAGVVITAMLLWVINTHCQWANGPPAVVLSDHGAFDDRPHVRRDGPDRRRDPKRQPVEG
jgi:hypothetical protein